MHCVLDQVGRGFGDDQGHLAQPGLVEAKTSRQGHAQATRLCYLAGFGDRQYHALRQAY